MEGKKKNNKRNVSLYL